MCSGFQTLTAASEDMAVCHRMHNDFCLQNDIINTAKSWKVWIAACSAVLALATEFAKVKLLVGSTRRASPDVDRWICSFQPAPCSCLVEVRESELDFMCVSKELTEKIRSELISNAEEDAAPIAAGAEQLQFMVLRD